MNKFLNELLSKYAKVNFPVHYKDISKIDKAISWYFSDSTAQYITLAESNNYKVLEMDIRQAFTTICRCLFDSNSEFIQNMNQISDKKSRNIFIATHLNGDQLRWINIICKVIVMGTLFEIDQNAMLLELKKDGIVFGCDTDISDKIMSLNDHIHSQGEFNDFIFNNNFKFSIDNHVRYIRSNRTSYFWNGEKLIIKGLYKHCPVKLSEIQSQILQNSAIDFDKILKIFSRDYFDVISMNYLSDILKEYYLCSNNKYLSFEGKYIPTLKEDKIEPRSYLKTFIYPILLSTKLY